MQEIGDLPVLNFHVSQFTKQEYMTRLFDQIQFLFVSLHKSLLAGIENY